MYSLIAQKSRAKKQQQPTVVLSLISHQKLPMCPPTHSAVAVIRSLSVRKWENKLRRRYGRAINKSESAFNYTFARLKKRFPPFVE